MSENKIQLLLWCHADDTFHIEPLEETIKHGLRAWTEDREAKNWVILRASPSSEELRALATKLRKERPQRNC